MDTVVELFQRACDLKEADRATLAGLLIESLESEHDTGLDSAWAQELDRRLAELDSGLVEAVPWEEVRAKMMSGRRGA